MLLEVSACEGEQEMREKVEKVRDFQSLSNRESYQGPFTGLTYSAQTKLGVWSSYSGFGDEGTGESKALNLHP